MLYKITLEQGKTHCRRGLITDPIVHFVTDTDANFEQNQLYVAEFTEMHVSLAY